MLWIRHLFTVPPDPPEVPFATMSGISSIGSLPSAFQSAATTINRAVAGASGDAATVASSSVAQDPNAMLMALVDAKQQLLYTQAGAKMMSTANAMLGAIIDVSA
jgi:hypothetical protein